MLIFVSLISCLFIYFAEKKKIYDMIELKTDTKNIGIEQARAIAYTQVFHFYVLLDLHLNIFKLIPLSLCAQHTVHLELWFIWQICVLERVLCACMRSNFCIYTNVPTYIFIYLFHPQAEKALHIVRFVVSFDFLIKSQRRDEHTSPISACYLTVKLKRKKRLEQFLLDFRIQFHSILCIVFFLFGYCFKICAT